MGVGTAIRLKEGCVFIKRTGNLYEQLISNENLEKAILTVCSSHKRIKYHDACGRLVSFPNKTTLKILSNYDYYVAELKQIIENGFTPSELKTWIHYDKNAKKYREIAEPKLWPDQCVHHALMQVMIPTMMKDMDYWCCGSIPGKGPSVGIEGIKNWMKNDRKGTKYCLSLDIRHFYKTLDPKVVMYRLRHRFKDYRLLSLVWRVIQGGFVPGSYHAQWFANTTLQPLDKLIRQQPGVSHYVRYMDNFTIFSPNKRKLKRVKETIEKWLNARGLAVKPDWQIFNTYVRRPYAMGYTYGHGYTILAKRNQLNLKRQISKYKWKIRNGKRIMVVLASSLLSRIGQLKHCNSYQFYKYHIPKKFVKELKNVVRQYMQERSKRNAVFIY